MDACNVEHEAELMAGRLVWPQCPVISYNGREGEVVRCYRRCHSRVKVEDGCKCLTLEREGRLLKNYTCKLCIRICLNETGDDARAVLLEIPCFEAWRRATRERARRGEPGAGRRRRRGRRGRKEKALIWNAVKEGKAEGNMEDGEENKLRATHHIIAGVFKNFNEVICVILMLFSLDKYTRSGFNGCKVHRA